VLVAVADEDFVQEFVDILKHGFVMRSAGEERGGGDAGGCRGHGEGVVVVVVRRVGEELHGH